MSRSGYTDDGGDYLELYRGAVDMAIRGKRGQQLLHEMLVAMDAMPEKVLIEHELESAGRHCALGVVGKARGINMTFLNPDLSAAVAKTFNIADSMAREIAYENDEGCWPRETPEARWVRMRAWVVANLLDTGTQP